MAKEETVDASNLHRAPDFTFKGCSYNSTNFNKIEVWIKENIIRLTDIHWSERTQYRITVRCGDDNKYYNGLEFIGKVAANTNDRYPSEWVETANEYIEKLLLE